MPEHFDRVSPLMLIFLDLTPYLRYNN